MNEAVQQLFEQLEESRSRFLATLSRFDEEQLAFRPRANSWSALEVAEHVLLAEQISTDMMLRLGGRPSRPRKLLQRLGYVAVWVVLKLGIRVNSPARVTNPTGGMTLREIRGDWDGSRRRLREHLETLGAEGLAGAGFAHPVAGPLNLREAMLFFLRHVSHHQAQLERIQRHSRFPRAHAALSPGAS